MQTTVVHVFGVIAGSVLMSACAEPATGRQAQPLDASTVNVRDFGALGNGSHDDRAAIQAALNSGAQSVFVPNGTYAVGTVGAVGACNLSIPAGVTLYGESRDGAILIQLPVPAQLTSVRLLQTGPCQNDPPLTPNVTVHDLTLDGNKLNQPTADEHRAGLFATAAPNVYVHDVTSKNFTGDGFYFYNNTSPRVDHVLATSNNRDGLVVSGGIPSGSITNSTLSGNAVQQFDSEGGTEFNLLVSANTIDGAGSNDYAMTISGLSDAAHSAGWVIDHNTIHGGIRFVWTSNMVFSNNTGVNPTTKPAIEAMRSNDGLVIRGNTFTNTQTSVTSSAVVYLGGTGVGAVPSAVISDNTLIVQAKAESFGVRAEGCGSVEVLRNTIIGPGRPAPGYPGVGIRASVTGQDFVSASVHDNVIRNWGALGVSVTGIKGNSAARLRTVDVSYNTFDDTAGTMLVAMNLDADGAHAAKDVRVVGNTLSGGCTTLMSGAMTGTHQTLTGDRWVITGP